MPQLEINLPANSPMKWGLFIDDERFPKTPYYMLARTSREAILMVQYYGLPTEICFDHDLSIINGVVDTSIEFINWLTNKIVDGVIVIPSDFKYSIHSQNPVGASNIKSKMDQLLEHYQEN